MISFDDAVALVATLARPLANERIGLDQADGRVLAVPVVAQWSSPAVAVSAMDGYAVREADLAGGPVRLPVMGAAYAGHGLDQALARGACVRVFTGAPLPAGTDRVVMQEVVGDEGPVAFFAQAPCGGRHVRAAGCDFRAGDELLAAGLRLTPQRLIAAAAADLSEVEVVSRPRVMILSTGDELHEPGHGTGVGGSIPESVSFGLAALVRAWGGEVAGRRRLGDQLPLLQAAAGAALEAADLVVVTGGASVGQRDYAKAMFAPFGLDCVFAKVAIKPGKPVWLGRAGGKLVVGLPGNPTAALVTARLLLAPLIAGLGGRDPRTALAWRAARLAVGLEACGDRETFVRARNVATGVSPLADQDSSSQKTLALADLLIRRRPGDGAAAVGDGVEVLDL
ncbi:MAG: molybdopterin molybdotransferase MoeA [Phenylobacterium sp.]|uniref:molybdopterin molybdotransferase MoeA n=1 Tax=Phenylobacterium sp. TaxID=1871053 RepID=UPI001B3FDC8B|nr:molybdopterin molybdotransferase MoeA [Phenylobacterium sp.]MBP7651171.1 molybdopterin molybdotransferase MoeA [Phenylobacterium sp.]MBP7817414.1 molybdopterin molybdotransferase MoeA [Phenylobacterium sp.]MBP9231147.1 molybdopterin molybdotransferase MoeA [Phenylobacterium sp.]MBP9753877.1 molybdopterin molybdotransferase MoeA [Phenylobacterium sp.]